MARLVQVTLVVKVPDNTENVEDYLNDVSFDCMTPDGEDIYVRVERYDHIGEDQ